MYSLISVDDEEVTKAKKVNEKTKYKEFFGVLFNKKLIRIQSKFKVNCIELELVLNWSCFDDKRYVLGDGVNTLAYFHKDIKN